MTKILKCWKCGRNMTEITCSGDSIKIEICPGVKYIKNRIIFRSVTHYPLTIKKTSKY